MTQDVPVTLPPVPVTLSYDITTPDNNQRTYIRSALERFHWRRLGGSVFRYDGVVVNGERVEDWLNHVIPALAFFRAYVQQHNIALNAFTIDAHSVAMLDLSDPQAPFGAGIQDGTALILATPTNPQSSESALRAFVNGVSAAAP